MSESSPSHSVQAPHEYYSSLASRLALQDKFNDIDNETHFEAYLRHLHNAQTQNFVLDFGNDDAWCAVDLEEEDIALLLRNPKPKCFGTRWINIWAPEVQKDTIKAITNHYGVSKRLQGMMCADPVGRPSKSHESTRPPRRSSYRNIARSLRSHTKDLEDGYPLKNLTDPDEILKAASSRGLKFAHVANQIWHFCSVDHGPRYTCLGYNALYVIPGVDIQNGMDLPDGQRLWSWLILFDDGTVVSIQENPAPKIAGSSLHTGLKIVLEIVRRNTLMIFSGVSKQQFTSSESDSLVTIRVRPFGDSGSDNASIQQEDGPSLLFYYIFDDWVSSYGLIAKREHKYGVLLDQLRGDMMDKPIVDLVDELHWLGRRLAVLKRLYQSYELIMTRVLQRQRLLRDEARSNRPKITTSHTVGDAETMDLQQSTLQKEYGLPSNVDIPLGVQLSSAAVTRFERLLDRIKLYCLSEIEACLAEKESLTFLNFNLIALKDSQAVEKLTRITILLAKITILFLPVSLMTAYFSTELKNVKGVYTQAEYWISFAVIMVLSISLLTLFGYASDTVEGRPIYQSLVRTLFHSSRDRLTHQRQRTHGH